MNDDTTELDSVEVLVEAYSAKLREGSAPTINDFVSRHPNHADELRDILSAAVAMEEVRHRRRSNRLRQTKMPDYIGDFRIIREIGRGGMGIVYEAFEKTLKRRVALKILPSYSLLDTNRLQRFEREAQAAAKLHHTNIVPVFGVGEADGMRYFVMQFIDGRSLEQVLTEIRKLPHRPSVMPANGGKQDYWRWAAGIMEAVANALQHAHSQGVMHRDVKPGNILIDAQGTAWMADFGLAHVNDDNGLTRSNDIIGTLQYLPPENFTGGTPDARCDIYSLGLTLYEILTRRAPYTEKTVAGLIHAVTTCEPVNPRTIDQSIPKDLETIVLKASSRSIERRYQTAAELAGDLRRFLDDRPILARKTGAFEQLFRWYRRNRAVATLSGIAVIATISTLIAVWIGYSETSAAYARLKKETEATRTEKLRAEANVEMSLQALETMFNQLKADPLLFRSAPHPFPGEKPPFPEDRLPGIRPYDAFSLEVLQSILLFYERFAEKNATNPKLRLESVRAYDRVGELYFKLGQTDKAETAFQKALETATDLAQYFQDQLELNALTGQATAHIGDVLQCRQEYDTADVAYEKAIRLITPLLSDIRLHPEVVRIRMSYANSRAQQKRYDDAIRILSEALQISEKDMVEIPPAVNFVAIIYGKLAEIYELAGNHDESNKAREKLKALTANRGKIGDKPHENWSSGETLHH